MPKSRVRKKPVYTPPPTRSSKHKVSPVWLAPVMVACLLIGLAWIALYYVTQANMPVLSALGGWNLVCGFCLIVAGVVLATQWRLSPDKYPGGTSEDSSLVLIAAATPSATATAMVAPT